MGTPNDSKSFQQMHGSPDTAIVVTAGASHAETSALTLGQLYWITQKGAGGVHMSHGSAPSAATTDTYIPEGAIWPHTETLSGGKLSFVRGGTDDVSVYVTPMIGHGV